MMLFFNANFICYYFYPTKKREESLFWWRIRESLWQEAVPVRGKWRACAERGSFLPAMQALAFPGSKVLPFTPKRVHFPILSTNIISRSTNQKGALTKMIALFVKAPFVWVFSIRGLSNKIKTWAMMLRLLRKCNSFSQQQKSDRLGTFPSGNSSAMWNIRNQFCFVLNLYTCGWGNATHPFTY